VHQSKTILTRQTSLLHLLHSPTISRAQAPTFPLVSRSTLPPSRPYMVHASKLLLNASPSNAAGSARSFSHRSENPMSMDRYCSRSAYSTKGTSQRMSLAGTASSLRSRTLNCRHVRDSSCSEVRSRDLANCAAMLRSWSGCDLVGKLASSVAC